MRYGFFLATFLFITISSCESSKVADFKDTLDQSERKAFDIILGKEGFGEKKLNCLIKEDYNCALAAVDQQALEFDLLITDIKKLSTDGILEGDQVKTASLEYYQSLKELHIYDRKEIEQQALIRTLQNNELNTAQNTLITLAKKKKTLYNKLFEKEALFQTAVEKFDTANGL